MDQDINTILERQITKLPPELKDFLSRGEWLTFVRIAGEKNSLSSEQITKFENEVLFVIVGMELESDLEKNIETNLGVNPQAALSLATEIKEQVLKSITNMLPTEVESLELEAPHDMLIPANLPTKTTLEQKLGSLTKNPDSPIKDPQWEERKKALGESTVATDYKGNDPYREPLQ
jgi:hypothetical protein